MPPEGVRLAAALSIQMFINEYVFSAGPDEEQKTEELRAEIEGAFGDAAPAGAAPARAAPAGPALEVKLLLLAMYTPLFNLPSAHAIRDLPRAGWSPAFQKVLDTTFLVRFEEEAIKNEVRSISRVEDATSAAVREQYEENPYPRWISYTKKKKMNFSGYIRQVAPRFSPPSMFNEPIRILVAGCGTGEHPIIRANTCPKQGVGRRSEPGEPRLRNPHGAKAWSR